MNKKWITRSALLLCIVFLSQSCIALPGPVETASLPTETDISPAPTTTLIPPTITPIPPTPTPTREVINKGNVERLMNSWAFSITDDSFRAVAISPDGQSVAAGSGQNTDSPDQKLRLWDAASGELLAETEKLDSIIWDLVYHPSGSLLAVGLDSGLVQMRSPLDLSLVQQYYLPGPVNSVSISPDGKKLAAGVADNGNGTVYIIDLDSGENLLSFWAHPYSIPDMDFSPDGILLATGAVDRMVKVWNSSTGALIQSLPLEGQGTAVVFSHDGGLLASGYCAKSENYVCLEASVVLWSTTTWSPFQYMYGSGDWCEDLAFSDTDDLVVGVDRNGYLNFWRVSDGWIQYSVQLGSFGANAVAISNDGYFLAAASDDVVGAWNIGE